MISIIPDYQTPDYSCSAEERRCFNQALHCALSLRGDPVAIIQRALAENEDFIIGQCLRAQMILLAMESDESQTQAGFLERSKQWSARATDNERLHIEALHRWYEGKLPQASEAFERILLSYPCDLLAIISAHQLDYVLGRTDEMRDRIARVMRSWSASQPGYGFVLGMYAFGLSECGDYPHAEKVGQWAVSLNRNDIYAIHAVSHIMEMQGRYFEGIVWLGEHDDSWATGTAFTMHLWWHLALYHLEFGHIQEVLNIWDQRLRAKSRHDALEDLDAASLLWRLNLLGVATGDRSSELAAHWERTCRSLNFAFNNMHAAMALALVGQQGAIEEMLEQMRKYADDTSDMRTNAAVIRQIGLQVCQAFGDFSVGHYAEVVNKLLPIRFESRLLGGSQAQRDVIALTLIEAAIRSSNHNLAHALMVERASLKGSSPLWCHNMARIFSGMGRAEEATRLRNISDKFLRW
jgi:tetratricopeptide (TPR) repeat protein